MTVERFKINWQYIMIAAVSIAILAYLIYNQVHEYYLMDDPMLQHLKEILSPLDPEISNVKLFKGNKSYTINKERIYICLFDKNGDYYSENLLVYVCLHEISHFLNKKDVGHTQAFHDKFEELLEKAAKAGIYDPSIPIDPDYCMHT